MNEENNSWKLRFERERKARKESELLLENKSREKKLFSSETAYHSKLNLKRLKRISRGKGPLHRKMMPILS